ncbi:MAG: squalene/phytoene synthase family protein [Chlamydiae bacterium]|nr:squalene/phytoene synthase family protein [Chlamydiota bacterium]MBI3276646.1 squalene/phytoene synthase family protein [Chlamydiota bacterium]
MNIAESYRYCSSMARSQAKNFYTSFLFLPREKRNAISSVYAFMRACDDITDNGQSNEFRKKSLHQWKEKVKKFLEEGDLNHPIFPSLQDTIHQFKIPHSYFYEILEGVQMDLEPIRFSRFTELYPYCYKVASVVGLICLYIFRFKEASTLEHGEACGIAFQLTNILRDLKEDAEMGRIYLPQEDMTKFKYSENDLIHFKINENFIALMKFESERAESFYQKAAVLPERIDPDSQRAIKVMIGIYHGILKKIQAKNYDVLSERIRLSFWEKVKIVISNL